MVEAWTTELPANIFTILDDEGYTWGYLNLYASYSYTEYNVQLGEAACFITNQTDTVFFPLQWSRACLSLEKVDTATSKATLVVDRQLLGEAKY